LKLHTDYTPIERGNISAETAFTIKTTAKSFEILSSGLYTDAKTAIIRELSSNAYDSHVAAGKSDIPFQIHLPNSLEPWLSIHDTGTGLSDDQIRGEMVPIMAEDSNGNLIQQLNQDEELAFRRTGGLYTTYFDSTKTDSNSFIGALGLGSKSPFSYTSTFEVISEYNGKRRIYSIFLNEHGIPTIALMGEFDSDASNGIEVKLAIKSDDFREFIDATASILRYFPVKPIIVGVINFQFTPRPHYRLVGKNWEIARSTWNSTKFIAVQGNIPYRVDTSKLDLPDTIVNFLKEAHIVAFFDIGDLEVSANREEIRYDTRSKEVLIQMIETIQLGLVDSITEKTKDFPSTYWGMCGELIKLSNELFGGSQIIVDILRTNIKLINNPLLKQYVDNKGNIKWSGNCNHYLYKYEFSTYKKLKRTRVISKLIPDGDFIFYNDKNTNGTSRIKQHMIDNEISIIYVLFPITDTQLLIEAKDNMEAKYRTITTAELETNRNSIIDIMGNPDLKIVSTDTNTIRRKKYNAKVFPVYKYKALSRYPTGRYRLSWTLTDHDLSEGGLYFLLEGGSRIFTHPTNEKLNAQLTWTRFFNMYMCALLKATNMHLNTAYTFDDMVGVSKLTWNKIKDDTNWINVFDIIRLVMPEFKKLMIEYKQFKATPDISSQFFPIDAAFLKQLLPSSHFRQWMEQYSNVLATFEKHQDILTALYEIDLVYKSDQQVYNKTEPMLFSHTNVYDTYPMLTFVHREVDNTRIEYIKNYIKNIDQMRSPK
jgi:hypothetical protein